MRIVSTYKTPPLYNNTHSRPKQTMRLLGWACMLLALARAACGDVGCSESDVTALRDTLRRSACRLVPGRGNETEVQAFQDYVLRKHGQPSSTSPFFSRARLFRPKPYLAWCRSHCSLESANITWCINIAYMDREVETCIRLGEGGQTLTNSTCEAELVGVPSVLDLPSECPWAGNVGCLALANLDWFYEAALLTCTVENDDCSSKSFTTLLTTGGVAQSPEFEVFPSSPFHVLVSNQLVFHVEISSSTDRITVIWQHGDTIHRNFIFEDPYCVKTVEQCTNDTHPAVSDLRRERVRAYRTTRLIQRDGCQTSSIYRLETYLIVDNVTGEDSGEYIFNSTSSHTGFPPITTTRSVNVSVDCQLLPERANCSSLSLLVGAGNSSRWDCTLTDHPEAKLILVLNKTTVFQPSKPGTSCSRNRSEVIFYVKETRKHTCYSSFRIFVHLCSATYSMAGEYSVGNSTGGQAPGSRVVIKVKEESKIAGISDAQKKGPVNPAVYAAPVLGMVLLVAVVLVILLLVLRSRKRTRDRRVLTRVHSPSLKEVAFMKEEGEPGLHSPSSPGNYSLGDPLEFPRNRLYIYSSKILGEGSFGRVLQAKAQGIVPGMPDRNIVAVKTTKDNATTVEREELLAELQLMKVMEPHENILNLLGHCTTPGGPLCLIVEYASYGNLRDFLRQCEEVVLSLNHMPHIPRNRSRTRTFSASSCSSSQPLVTRQDSVFTPGSGHTQFVFPSPTGRTSSGSSSSDGGGKMTAHHPDAAAVPLAHSVAPIGHDYLNTKGLVYMEDVHNFALQIACGLQHLSSMQIVHCDLAARNVLIAEGFVLKIADFGLARDISGREMYKKNPRGKIPVKWTAPEALEQRIFTVKSDVWSYGVLLWELFTYGHTPYPEVNLGTSYEPFISFLKAGNRMQQPESCPPSFHELMLECWHLDPNLRPSPQDIVAQLTPSDSIFDDADSEVPAEQQNNSSKVTPNSAGGHQSSQE